MAKRRGKGLVPGLTADPLAQAGEVVLATAVAYLQKQTDAIADPASRRSFWEDVGWHQQIRVYVGEESAVI